MPPNPPPIIIMRGSEEAGINKSSGEEAVFISKFYHSKEQAKSRLGIVFNLLHFVFYLIGFLANLSFNTVHGIAEFAHASSQSFGYLRNSFRAEKKQHHQQNDKNFSSAQVHKQ